MSHIKTFTELEKILATLRPNTTTVYPLKPVRMIQLMEFLGNPQNSYKIIHVAGTSGKTSTAYYAAALLRAAGMHVGLTISPHVDAVNERVQLDMVPLSEAVFCEQFSAFLEMIKPSGVELTYFEAITAFAFWKFAQSKVDYAVIEVGIGGLVDSTNIIDRADKVCIVSDIGYDHTRILGKTLEEIATHKAGIIQLHNVVFCHPQPEEIMRPIRTRSRQKYADLHVVEEKKSYSFLPLFQRRNFTLSEETVRFVLDRDGRPPLAARTIATTARFPIPARMEVRPYKGKTIVFDAAHNSQKMQALVRSLQEQFPHKSTAVLVGLLKSGPRFVGRMAHELTPLDAHVIVTGFPADATGHYGSADPQKIAELIQGELGPSKVSIVAGSSDAFSALMARPEEILVVTGSFYLLNHIRPLL